MYADRSEAFKDDETPIFYRLRFTELLSFGADIYKQLQNGFECSLKFTSRSVRCGVNGYLASSWGKRPQN